MQLECSHLQLQLHHNCADTAIASQLHDLPQNEGQQLMTISLLLCKTSVRAPTSDEKYQKTTAMIPHQDYPLGRDIETNVVVLLDGKSLLNGCAFPPPR
jgi:hypothetical protein